MINEGGMDMKKIDKVRILPIAFIAIIVIATQMSTAVAQPPAITVKGTVTYTNGTTAPYGWDVSISVDDKDYSADGEPWTGTTQFQWPIWDYSIAASADTGDVVRVTVNSPDLCYAGTNTAVCPGPGEVYINVTVESIDSTSPTIYDETPQGYINDNTPTISANYSDDGLGIDTTSVVMTVDDIPVTALALVAPDYVSFTVPPAFALSEGQHNVTVNVSDNCTNLATKSWSFTVDTSDPVINSVNLSEYEDIIEGEEITVTVNATDDNIANVTARSEGDPNERVFPLDWQGGDIWVGNISAINGTGVIVNVTAIDLAGNTIHNNSRTYNATEDTEPPTTTITTDGPTGTIDYNDVTFTWTGEDDATPTAQLEYSYKLDGSWSAWTPETSKTYNDLSNGDYTFMVKAKDLAKNEDPTPAERSFTVSVYYGGGGGAAAAPPAKAGETSVSTTETGEVTASVTASSVDAKAAATITAGTIAKDAAGKALTKVTVIPPSKLPAAPPAGTAYVGYTYNFGPTGATFDPAIEIAIEFDPAKFDKTPVIYVYESGAWKALETTVVGNKAIAMVTHFSTFVLFDEEVAPTPTPTAKPTAKPTAVPTAEPTAEPTEVPP